jgi:hypothetical protein
MVDYQGFGEAVSDRLKGPIGDLEGVASKAYGSAVMLSTAPFLSPEMEKAANSVGIDRLTGMGIAATLGLMGISYITKGKHGGNFASSKAFKLGVVSAVVTAGYYGLKRTFG